MGQPVNPRTLRALLPVLKEAREAGIRRIATGEGEDRLEVELEPLIASQHAALEPGLDDGAPDEDPGPAQRMLGFYEQQMTDFAAKWGPKANPVTPAEPPKS